MPANSTQRLPGHVAAGTVSPQLNARNVILKAEQLQIATIALDPRPYRFNDFLNRQSILFNVRHTFPFLSKPGCSTYAQPPASPLHDDPH
jgi:hypothetical protein